MRSALGSSVRVLLCAAVLAVAANLGTASALTPVPPPVVTFTTTPPAETTDTEATFSYSVANPPSVVSSFECYLDDAPVTPCTNPATVKGLTVGPHEFKVILASDPSTAKASATWKWTVKGLPKPSLDKIQIDSPSNVRPGAALTVKARIENSGEGEATGVRFCVKTPKAWVAGKAQRCKTINRIPAGEMGEARFKIRSKKKRLRAGYKVIKITVLVTGDATFDGPPPKPAISGMAINEKGMCDPRCKAELAKIPRGDKGNSAK